jgi:succinate dehydrogenase / fumarate reductase, cytochrome b subunit
MPIRPLSPHLSVYKFKYTLVTSILNRLTGIALSFALLLLAYWLMSVASGTLAQQRAQRLLGLPPLKLLYAAFLFAFCYHLCAGIRHLVWDTGHGLERAQSQRSAWLVVSASLLLTLILGYGLLHAGRAP